MPNTILEVMMLTMGKVFCVAHRHLLTAVPRKEQRSKFKNCHQGAVSSTRNTALGVCLMVTALFSWCWEQDELQLRKGREGTAVAVRVILESHDK